MPQWLSTVLTIVGVIVLPGLGFLVSRAARWAHIETKLAAVVEDLKEVTQAMRDQNDKTDRRIRWLEENTWKKGDNANAVRNEERGGRLRRSQ